MRLPVSTSFASDEVVGEDALDRPGVVTQVRGRPVARPAEPGYDGRMRNVIMGLGISLDGYIARPNGAVDFLFMPKDYSMAAFFATIDAAVMGRKTYDVAARMGGGSFGGSPIATYVCSRSRPPGERGGVTFTSRTPAALIGQLRKQKGKDIWLMGGGELARAFLKADLVDQLYLGVVPVLLGRGIPLFPSGFPQREFALVENKTYSRGMIALKYRRVRTRARRAGRSPRRGIV
jgi:dihydrofolate reductase